MKVACVPPDWKMPEPNIAMDEPNFDTVDNPGSWDAYSFRPKYKKEKGGPKNMRSTSCHLVVRLFQSTQNKKER